MHSYAKNTQWTLVNHPVAVILKTLIQHTPVAQFYWNTLILQSSKFE